MKTIFTTLIAFLLFAGELKAQCDPLSDSLVLVDIYNTAGGDDWDYKNMQVGGLNTGWLSDSTIGYWYGVDTNSEGCVTRIDLDGWPSVVTIAQIGTNNNLIGYIPNSIGELSHLEELSLAFTEYTGQFPDSLGNLDSLKTLQLIDWNLGNVPPALDNLESLEDLSLIGNGLAEFPEYPFNFPGLKLLKFERNMIPEIPAEIGTLVNLEELNVACNKLVELPPEIGALQNLTRLDVEKNCIQVVPPEIGLLVNLTSLDIENNKIQALPDEIGNLTLLRSLDISHNDIDSLPLVFGNLTSLRGFYARHVPLLNFPDTICSCTNLQELQTTYFLFKEIPSCIDDLTDLVYLEMGNGMLESIPPSLGGCAKVSRLILNNNRIQGEIPPQLNGLATINTLVLEGNLLEGDIPDALGELSTLQYLYLSGNRLEGGIPTSFENLNILRELHANFNQLDEALSPDIDWPSSIRILDLSHNKIPGELPIGLADIASLQVLQLENNQFTGQIPEEWGGMICSDLDLSHNLLEGPIPTVLPDVVFLETLDLSFNQLSGLIPDEFGDAPTLRNLYLQNNNLKGSLPSGLASSTTLNRIDVSNNALSVPIPPELQPLSLTQLDVESNSFTFEDVLDFYQNNQVDQFEMDPQKLFYQDTSFLLTTGEDITIDLGIDEDLNSNVYKWSKNGNDDWMSVTENTFTFVNPQTTDAGFYKVFVTNNNIPAMALTLESHPINIKVCNVGSDSLELVSLYNSTNGNAWSNNTNWLQPGSPIDNWFGITTNTEGCVQKIDLKNNNLTDTIPNLDLNTLDTLILNQNSLTGNIPIVNTPFLLHIDLSENMLSGSIPILNIPLVEYLNYGQNQLTDTLPAEIGGFMKLKVLDLADNQLQNTIPPDYGDLCELEEIYLDHNQLNGELPVELTKLYNLVFGGVDFSENDIDSLKQKIAWFCPYGDTILSDNPSYDRFLGICNVQCTGDEWDDLESFPWIIDTLNAIECPDTSCLLTLNQAGFVTVRGVTVVFVREICYESLSPPISSEVVVFYDCAGFELETATCDQQGLCTNFGAISPEEFESLDYDVRWSCGDSLPEAPSVSIEEIIQGPISKKRALVYIPVFPNPTSGAISFRKQDDMDLNKIRVTDMLGTPVSHQVINNGDITTLDIAGNNPGMLYLLIPGEGRFYTSRVLVMP